MYQISINIVKKTMRYLVLLLFLSNVVFAQQYMSKEGSIHFFSQAPMENIEAETILLQVLLMLQVESMHFV